MLGVEPQSGMLSPDAGTIPQYIEQDCPACDETGYTKLERYCHENWKIAQCSACRFVYLKNLPGYEAMEVDFAWEKTSKAEIARRLKSRPTIARVSRKSRWRLGMFGRSFDKVAKYFPAGNILDIGCGAGHLKIGPNAVPYGLEISKSLHATANARMVEKGGYAVLAPAIEGITQFEDEFFDGVIMFSYLEHEQNPRGILREVSRVLKPGGRAYVRVPNFGSVNRFVMQQKWCGFRYPDHINYFTLKTLRRMAHETGFKLSLLNMGTLIFDDNITTILVKR